MNVKMRQPIAAMLVGLTTMSILGCSRPPAYSQEVVGFLLREGKGAGSVHVRFVSSEASMSCESPGLEGVTDPRGAVRMRQDYQPTFVEQYVVAVRHFRLCVENNSSWRMLWEETTGPAPRTIEFQCQLEEDLKTPCHLKWIGQRLE